MTDRLFALSLGFVALIAAVQNAHAETTAPRCGARAPIIEHLADRYQERRRAIALAADNSVVEIYAADTGSWTMLATSAEGQTCLIASGEAFELLQDMLPARGKGI